jgi:uncharacterized protein (TIGR02271 family)
MITQDQVQSLTGVTAYDRSGEKIGRIDAVYYDDQTNEPSWIAVHTGLFGTHQTFVPLQGVEVNGDQVTVAFDKARVKDAPNIAEDGHLSPEEERQLYRYYGMEYGAAGGGNYDGQAAAQTVGRTSGVTEAGTGTGRPPLTGEGAVGRDTSGPTTDEAMTRSEEQLRVGTQTREAGRARLRKHVATEHQQVTVPVSHEEITLDREPITEANRGAAYDGPAISEEEHEVTLRSERPVVDTEAVPVERVRLGKQTVTEQQTVGGEVRKEEIELDRGGRDLPADRG